ncbi:MAG: ATP-binding protein [Anaerovibrio sp.]
MPEAAMREAVLNAVCHTQYNYGVPIQISVYEDRLYIANCGQLPANWTIDSLFRKHASRPYNPNIANVFYLAGFVESWGRGIEKICEACKEEHLPPPEFLINPSDIMVKFTAPDSWVSQGFTRVTDGVTDGVTDAELRILHVLQREPGYSYVKLAEILNVSKKTVAERIKSLKNKGIIQRIGNNKNGYWKINL